MRRFTPPARALPSIGDAPMHSCSGIGQRASRHPAWCVVCAVLLACVIGHAPIAHAAEPLVKWVCWHDGHEALQCVLTAAPLTPASPTPEMMAIGRRLPPIIQALRTNPAQFRHRLLNIPMHTMPFPGTRLEELATAVMCGSRRDCHVEMKPGPDAEALMAAGWDD